MQTLPKEVKVGPVTYQVREEARTAIGGHYGSIVHSESLITLTPGMGIVFQEITLWHEMLHAIMLNAGMREQDETLILALSHGIVQVLQDNPELVEEEYEQEQKNTVDDGVCCGVRLSPERDTRWQGLYYDAPLRQENGDTGIHST